MQSRHTDWLAQLARDQKGGVVLPAITRGEEYELLVLFDADLSASTFTGSIALSPDAPSSLADFTVSEGTWDGTALPVTFTLANTVTYPSDDNGDGLAEVVFQIERDGARYIAGAIPVSGAV